MPEPVPSGGSGFVANIERYCANVGILAVVGYYAVQTAVHAARAGVEALSEGLLAAQALVVAAAVLIGVGTVKRHGLHPLPPDNLKGKWGSRIMELGISAAEGAAAIYCAFKFAPLWKDALKGIGDASMNSTGTSLLLGLVTPLVLFWAMNRSRPGGAVAPPTPATAERPRGNGIRRDSDGPTERDLCELDVTPGDHRAALGGGDPDRPGTGSRRGMR